MRLTRFLIVVLITAFSNLVSASQEIIEGDLAPGRPFDGTSGRASMFDLYQVANITKAVLSTNINESDQVVSARLAIELSARGYPGTRVEFLSEIEKLDRSCSRDGTVEIRVSRNTEHGSFAVAVAGEYWFSNGKTDPGEEESLAQDCQPTLR